MPSIVELVRVKAPVRIQEEPAWKRYTLSPILYGQIPPYVMDGVGVEINEHWSVTVGWLVNTDTPPSTAALNEAYPRSSEAHNFSYCGSERDLPNVSRTSLMAWKLILLKYSDVQRGRKFVRRTRRAADRSS